MHSTLLKDYQFMWFKNLSIYRINNHHITEQQLSEALSERMLRNCLQLEMQSHGWVKPKDNVDSFVHVSGERAMIAMGIEKKLLPTAVINQYAKERIAVMEQNQGYKAGKRQISNIKEAVLIELMPKAFVQQQMTYAWIDLNEDLLLIDTTSQPKAEILIELLLKTVNGIKLAPLTTNTSPSTAMTRWLSGDAMPAVFTIDRDCELQGMDNEKSTIRYTHHSLEPDETARHIKAGKKVTRLAMTWADKISFVLHENLQIKRIAPLDILKETTSGSEDADEIFDSDFSLMTGELSRMLPDLLHALGGEKTAD